MLPMIDIKKILEDGGSIRKYEGVAPEGFVLVHEGALESLKDFEIWKEWKHGVLSINDLNKKSLNNT